MIVNHLKTRVAAAIHRADLTDKNTLNCFFTLGPAELVSSGLNPVAEGPVSLFSPSFRIDISMIASTFSLLVTMETEEARIAIGLRRRDPDLLDMLIEQYQHRLLRYLVHLTGNLALAEDLFQETWLRVLEKGHQYDGRNKFSTWLFSIAHNVAIDHLRKRQPASLDAMNEQDDGPVIDPPTGGPSAFDLIAQKEVAEQIETAMERVPVIYREVLVLRFQEQLKLEEIAQLIHIPLATVKTRLYRGVMALRPAFQAGAR